MPKVTLLKPATKDYTLVRGNTAIKFMGGVPREVSPSIALTCRKLATNGRVPFSIEDMPQLVKSEQGEQNVGTKKKSTRQVSPKKLFDVKE